MPMTERNAFWLFFAALGVMIAIGALLPTVLPGLIRLLNSTVLKEEQHSDRH